MEFLYEGVDTNRGMSIVGDRDLGINRLVLELRTRHREDDLLAMHRESRTLNDYRRAQEVELNVPIGQCQFALGGQPPRGTGIAVNDDLAANRPHHAEVVRIDE